MVRRLGVIAVAKRAGFSLDEARILLEATDGGDPAHEPLRALAERKLPEIEALIDRAEQVKRWLEVAQDCGCETLDVCGLFDEHVSARSNAANGQFGHVHLATRRDAPVGRS
ncbi:MAG: MerR family DNA-binding protein [Thermoleophilaceae bacterium]|nr:MerR family DNA-binding protein [Thermoleophilaceae bacterium]